MFFTAILDTVIGLIFTFMTISLVSSALTESVASVFKWRSNTLLQSVKDLLNDQQFNDLAQKLYDHALVNPRFAGAPAIAAVAPGAVAPPPAVRGKPDIIPAYIDPNHFASALTDILNIDGKTTAGMKTEIAKINNPQIEQLLNGVVDRAGGNVAQVRNALATWFDSSMDRVSGVYKRRTQWVSFVIALAITVTMNVNTVQVAKTLWRQPEMTKTLSVEKMEKAADARAQLEKLPLPIGWTSADWDKLKDAMGKPVETAFHGKWLVVMFGWLITAGATLFGAPFWFDTLQQFVRLKGSGPSPTEKKDNKGAAA
jgi:hypothetical protein